MNYINFSAKKYGKSSYLITIENIEDGEYAIAYNESRSSFNLFAIKSQGIDNPEKLKK